MANPYWPLFDLALRTDRLELRLPQDEELIELCKLAAGGIHEVGEMPFSIPWTQEPSPLLERNALQWWWRCRAEWKPEDWRFTTAVYCNGTLVGMQDLCAKNFAKLGAVTTGSWLARKYQGQGIGREMRAAVLHLAFAGLGASRAESCAMWDNPASIRVSQSLGYRSNGSHLCVRQGKSAELVDFLMLASDWEESTKPRYNVTIANLEPALQFFGASTAAVSAPDEP